MKTTKMLAIIPINVMLKVKPIHQFIETLALDITS